MTDKEEDVDAIYEIQYDVQFDNSEDYSSSSQNSSSYHSNDSSEDENSEKSPSESKPMEESYHADTINDFHVKTRKSVSIRNFDLQKIELEAFENLINPADENIIDSIKDDVNLEVHESDSNLCMNIIKDIHEDSENYMEAEDYEDDYSGESVESYQFGDRPDIISSNNKIQREVKFSSKVNRVRVAQSEVEKNDYGNLNASYREYSEPTSREQSSVRKHTQSQAEKLFVCREKG